MAKRHLYLFAYDIGDCCVQRQVRGILRGYAVGGQKSLFECWLTQGELEDLCVRLPLMLAPTDRLQVVRLDERVTPLLLGCAKSMAYEPFVIG
ncbi:CRISPR-associated endonuclease Cas2 [Uruburuella testudinis]|uniref:CRISPR-associated endoribonuclease Cas2 n=1 Tax=Uruburuella testudinis TaxID=1282863 RepID=A0ABY4DT94_9NEIS|nr:CRISPR-associated endonuclease Cas2 [Uruburuella testudinis]UOO81234.1 CRISPR-associated endonuclease Cas2 [Uruburuella testudinis]